MRLAIFDRVFGDLQDDGTFSWDGDRDRWITYNKAEALSAYRDLKDLGRRVSIVNVDCSDAIAYSDRKGWLF